MNPILQNLLSDEFISEVGFELPTSAMYRVLHSTEEFDKVKFGLRSNIIGQREIQEFVDSLMEEFRPGRHFGYNPALMLLAVALEQDHRDFAVSYLQNLSSLDVSGLDSASRMAEYCMSRRGEHASNTFQKTELGPFRETGNEWITREESSGTRDMPDDEWTIG